MAESDIAELERFGGRLTFIPFDSADLDTLRRVGPAIRDLSLETGHRVDLRFLETFPNLERLLVNAPQATSSVDLTRLPNLRAYRGTFRKFESVLEVETLESFEPFRMPWDLVETIKGPLQKLRLSGARPISEVPKLVSGADLQVLALNGCNQLDVQGVRRYRGSLRELMLTEAKKLTSVDAVLDLDLDYFGIGDCRDVEPIDALLQLNAREIFVAGANVFDQRFRDSVAHPDRWTFPPRKGRRPVQAAL